ncbi:MAG: tail fiber domain-containing protein, partial [Candidatus Aenigmatarchaeota archaeon]
LNITGTYAQARSNMFVGDQITGVFTTGSYTTFNRNAVIGSLSVDIYNSGGAYVAANMNIIGGSQFINWNLAYDTTMAEVAVLGVSGSNITTSGGGTTTMLHSMIAAGQNVNITLGAGASIRSSAIIGSSDFTNLVLENPAGFNYHMVVLGIDGNAGTFNVYENTVHMPKVRMGLGTNGALPADQSPTRVLGFDPTTGIVSDEAFPSAEWTRDGSGNLVENSITITGGTNALNNVVIGGNYSYLAETQYNLQWGSSYIFSDTSQVASRIQKNIILSWGSDIAGSDGTRVQYCVQIGGHDNDIGNTSTGNYYLFNSFLLGGNNNAINQVDVYNAGILGGQNNTVNGHTDSVILGGNGITSTQATTVFMPKLVIGRGTGGALATTGATHSLGYNSTTGEVVRTTSSSTFWQPTTGLSSSYNVFMGQSAPTFSTGYAFYNYAISANVFLTNNTTNFVGGTSGLTALYNIFMGRNLDVNHPGGSLSRGLEYNLFMGVSNSITLGYTADFMQNNIWNMSNSAWALDGYSYIKNNIASGSDIDVTGTRASGDFFDNAILGVTSIDFTIGALYAGRDIVNFGVIGSKNLNITNAASVSGGAVIGVSYASPTAFPIVSDMVWLPKLKIGRGTNGAIPTTGATHYLGIVSGTGEVVRSVAVASDERLKHITGELDLAEAMNLIRGINPIAFTWDQDKFEDEDKGEVLGFSAQNVQSVRKELVHTIFEKDGNKYLGVKEKQLNALIIAALKNVDDRLTNLENKLDS